MPSRVERGSRIFRRFDQPSVQALQQSVKQAEILGDAYVGIEHILFGIFVAPEGNEVQNRLKTLRINPLRLQNELLEEMEFVKREPEVIGITPSAKRVIEIAAKKPNKQGPVTPVDITRVILFYEGQSKAAKVLNEAGITLDVLAA